MQGEVFRIGVHGVHESLSNVRVIQSEGMSKLMGCHQEEAVTCNMYRILINDEGKYKYMAFLPTIPILVFLLLPTLVGTETPFLVIIIVVGGTAPQLAISSSLTSAGVILFTQEHKREVAGLSLWISTGYSSVCPNKDITTTVR